MKIRASVVSLVFIGVSVFIFAGLNTTFSAKAQSRQPSAKAMDLDTHGKDYLQLLGGPPESVTMRSGLVELAPQHSVGKHSTHQNEEILIVLDGKGEMIFKDRPSVPVEAHHAVYCPPQTEHDVKNTGNGPLRYVYVVAERQVSRPGREPLKIQCL